MTTENWWDCSCNEGIVKIWMLLVYRMAVYNIVNVCMKTESDSSLNALIIGINAKPQGHWYIKCAWADVCKILIEKISVVITNKNLESSESLLGLLVYIIWNWSWIAECSMSTIWWNWNWKLNVSIITELGVTQYCLMSVRKKV